MFDKSVFASEVGDLLRETFEDVHGQYLDKGTSLIDTIGLLDASMASTPMSCNGETVVAHICHLTFYLDVLGEYMRGERTEKADWESSWLRKEANEEDWRKIIDALKSAYHRTLQLVQRSNLPNDEEYIGGSMSMIAHSAFHLGAIRQIIDCVKNR